MKCKRAQAKEVLISEEDKVHDPVYRTIYRKVRNLSKKITEIEGIETRDNLKPQQVEKVRSKPTLIEQRKKYEEFALFHKAVIQENASEPKPQPAQDFTKIAQLITLRQLLSRNPNGPTCQKFSQEEFSLINSLAKEAKPEETVGEKFARISHAINNYMDSEDLVAKVEKLFTDPIFNSQVVEARTRTSTIEIKKEDKSSQSSEIDEPRQPSQKQEPTKEAKQVSLVQEKVQVIEKPAPVTASEVSKPVASPPVLRIPQPPKVPVVPAPVIVPIAVPVASTLQVEKKEIIQPTKTEKPVPPTKEAQPQAQPNPVAPAPAQPQPVAVSNPTAGASNKNLPVAPTTDQTQTNGSSKPYYNNYRPKYKVKQGDGYHNGYRASYNNGYRNKHNGGHREARQPRDESESSLESSHEKDRLPVQYTTEEKANLAKDGFIVVQKKPYKPRPKYQYRPPYKKPTYKLKDSQQPQQPTQAPQVVPPAQPAQVTPNPPAPASKPAPQPSPKPAA